MLTRREALRTIGASAAAGIAAAGAVHAVLPASAQSVDEQILHHVTELEKLLVTKQSAQPLRIIVGGDHPVVVQPLPGRPFRPIREVPSDLLQAPYRDSPADLWRISTDPNPPEFVVRVS